MEPHLTGQDLRSIRERADRATPGPWCVAGSPRDFVIAKHGGAERCSDNPVVWADDDCLSGNPVDAEFIAHARADVPRLADEVDRLRQVVRRVLVWQLGPSFADDVEMGCPDRDLAEEIIDIITTEDH
jgi:hypothetical protein